MNRRETPFKLVLDAEGLNNKGAPILYIQLHLKVVTNVWLMCNSFSEKHATQDPTVPAEIHTDS